jgi:leucyl-tRNA synthetase
MKLVNQGMILGEVELTGYRTAEGTLVSAADVSTDESGETVLRTTGETVSTVQVDAEQVEKQGDVFVLKENPAVRVDSRAFKMSKSRGNVINPDVIVREYGADSLRLYEMFMGPLEATKPWSMAGVNGVRGFLDRAWRMIVDDRAEQLQLAEAIQAIEPSEEQNRVLHRTIMEVTQDIQSMEFNTAIARMMEFVNYFTKQPLRPKSAIEQFVLLLSPFAPHIAEELWQVLGHDKTLAYEDWPAFDEELTKEDTIEIPVQIRGKLRGKIRVSADITEEDLETAARTDERIEKLLEGKQIVRTIVVPGRLVNFVVK